MADLQFRINQKIEFVNEEGLLGISLVQEWTRDWFMVTIPLKGNERRQLQVGDYLTGIYYHDDGRLYMFNSKVLDRTIENIPMYKLSVPDTLTRVQRRNYVRLVITIPVRYTKATEATESKFKSSGWEANPKDDSIPWESGTIIDISGGGVNLSANSPLEEDSNVYIYIQIEDLKVGVKGKIVRRYTKILDNMITYQHGIKFIDISEAERDKIIGFIFKKYRKIKHIGVEP